MLTAEAVGSLFLGAANCSTIACLQQMDVQAILNAQTEVVQSAPRAMVGVSSNEPIRPVVDGTLVTQPFVNLVNTGGFTNKNRQIMFTTVKNEAGPTIAAISQDTDIPADQYDSYVQALMPAAEAQKVLSSGLYEVGKSADSAREELEVLGTDWIWRW